MPENKTNEQLVKELIAAFSKLKDKMEDPHFIQLESSMLVLMENQRAMKEDLSELKKTLLNPYDGVIVQVGKNTEYREGGGERDEDMSQLVEEHKALVEWKKTVSKVFVAILGSAGAVLTWFLTEFLN